LMCFPKATALEFKEEYHDQGGKGNAA